MLGFGRSLMPGAPILAPRGRVSEGGAARFFSRSPEDPFRFPDFPERIDELAGFVREAADVHGLEGRPLVAVGYSNGANAAAGLMLRHPGLLAGGALLRPMLPEPAPAGLDLTGTRGAAAGRPGRHHDPAGLGRGPGRGPAHRRGRRAGALGADGPRPDPGRPGRRRRVRAELPRLADPDQRGGESAQAVGHVAAGLHRQLVDAVGGERLGPLAQLRRGAGERDARDVPASITASSCGSVSSDEVAAVERLVAPRPAGAASHRVDVGARPLAQRVRSRPSSRQGCSAKAWNATPTTGPTAARRRGESSGSPSSATAPTAWTVRGMPSPIAGAQQAQAARIEDPGHRAVAPVAGERLRARAAARDVERHVAVALRPRDGHVADRRAALDVGALLAGQQAAQVVELAGERGERHGPQAEREPPVKPGADRGAHPAGRERGQRAQAGRRWRRARAGRARARRRRGRCATCGRRRARGSRRGRGRATASRSTRPARSRAPRPGRCGRACRGPARGTPRRASALTGPPGRRGGVPRRGRGDGLAGAKARHPRRRRAPRAAGTPPRRSSAERNPSATRSRPSASTRPGRLLQPGRQVGVQDRAEDRRAKGAADVAADVRQRRGHAEARGRDVVDRRHRDRGGRDRQADPEGDDARQQQRRSSGRRRPGPIPSRAPRRRPAKPAVARRSDPTRIDRPAGQWRHEHERRGDRRDPERQLRPGSKPRTAVR